MRDRLTTTAPLLFSGDLRRGRRSVASFECSFVIEQLINQTAVGNDREKAFGIVDYRNATYDMLGPTHLLLSFTNAYAACIPLSAHTSDGTLGERCAAARITSAMTSVAERETPHWQLQHKGVSFCGDCMSSWGYTHWMSTPSPRSAA